MARAAGTPWGRRQAATLALALTAAFCSSAGAAAELSVSAPVVDVQPITAPAVDVERCDPRPGTAAGLTALMAWDLGLRCRTERVQSSTITGYRVFYRWDDRVYSQVMASAPGPTVPLTVRLD